MPSTRSLRPAAPRLPLDVEPLARVLPDGRMELLTPAFPPLGRVRVAWWRPGARPAFGVAVGRIARGWRWEGPALDAFVVCWVAEGDPAQPI